MAIPKKNKWDDEDVEEDVKDSWEDFDEEEKKQETKKPAAPVKKKVPLKQKIAEKQAAEEQKKKELEAKKLAQEEEEEEDDYARTQRMRQLELEADMMSATDLFSGVSIGIVIWTRRLFYLLTINRWHERKAYWRVETKESCWARYLS